MGIKRKQLYYKKKREATSATKKRRIIPKIDQKRPEDLLFFFGNNAAYRHRRCIVNITFNKSNCYIVLMDVKQHTMHFLSGGFFAESFNKNDKMMISHIQTLLRDIIRIILLYKLKNVYINFSNYRMHKIFVVTVFDLFQNAGIHIRFVQFLSGYAHNGVKGPAERRKKRHHRQRIGKKRGK